jgi:hypothetical protein
MSLLTSAATDRTQMLRRRIRLLTWLFIIGLILSGATAIPLPAELDYLVNITGARQLIEMPASTAAPAWAVWLVRIQSELRDLATSHPVLFYGTDWLAFGHFMIALAFVGALRDPVRNVWLFTFGIIACDCVIPYAFVFGAIRGIPIWWRLIDCSFGVFGIIPVWFCKKWTQELADADGLMD